MDEAEWVDSIERVVVYALRGKSWFNAWQGMQGYLRDIEPTGKQAARCIDLVLARLAGLDGFNGFFAAKIRIILQCTAYNATRGMPGSIERVLPNADTCWVSTIYEALSTRVEATNWGQPALTGLNGNDVRRLHSAWSALDWDGTLSTETLFERPAKQMDYRTRPWTPLADMIVRTTSFDRLYLGESDHQTLTALFARRDVSLDEKTALAVALAKRGRGAGWMARDALEVLTLALAPHLAADRRPLPSSLARVGKKLATRAEHASLFERLPT